MTAVDISRARRLLMRRDPILARAIRSIGPCALEARRRPDHLLALVSAIVSQQLSTAAAATIFRRFLELFPSDAQPAVSDIEARSDAELRAIGLSRQKVAYVRDLCGQISAGRLRLAELDDLSDEEVVARLTAVKGLGRWSAEMFLMFRLLRPDVLPAGDLGIVRAVQRLYRLRRAPDARRILEIGEAWRPYRSVASWYLWQTLRKSRPTRRRAPAKVNGTATPSAKGAVRQAQSR